MVRADTRKLLCRLTAAGVSTGGKGRPRKSDVLSLLLFFDAHHAFGQDQGASVNTLSAMLLKITTDVYCDKTIQLSIKT